jgi:hypothetical protein
MPGWKSLIVCDGVPGGELPVCSFESIIELIKAAITDMVILSTLVVVGLLAYVGILLLTSGGNEGARKKGKDIFFQVIIGYLWILGGWLVIYTITSALLSDDYFTFLGD